MPIQRSLRGALTAVAVLAAACDRGHHEAPPPPTPVVQTPTGCQLPALPLKVPAGKRVVAIGDLHGDLGAARDALRAAGVIDASDHWSGADTIVVQAGDVLDRGDDESKILSLLDRLDGEARAKGGALIELLGNHELMNSAHDFRYVTPGGMRDFDGDRASELGPAGVWAKKLAHHNVVAIVGDTVISHAGVLPAWADRLDQVNLDARCWLDGQSTDVPSALSSDDSPVWTRAWGGDDVDCAQLKTVLDKLGAKRMVVAHTVQKKGISSACDGALWRIDVGLAKLYNGPIEVLELGDPPKVLTGTRTGS